MDTPPPSRSAVQRPALPPAAEVTLSAADPPRRSMVACWLPGTERAQEDLFTLPSEAPALPGEPTLFTLVLPARGGDKPSATDTIVHLVPLIDLVPQLLATSAAASSSLIASAFRQACCASSRWPSARGRSPTLLYDTDRSRW